MTIEQLTPERIRNTIDGFADHICDLLADPNRDMDEIDMLVQLRQDFINKHTHTV